ncbi:MAG: PAS domain-containing protein [Clostridia bacterium]|nr:PAS domain-containing protein [Clostridia bacterium]
MKKRIIKNTFLTALLVLVLSLTLVCGAMYRYYSEELHDELRAEAEFIYSGFLVAGEEYLDILEKEYIHPAGVDTRITLIAADGTVLYDSIADASDMDNHLDREEVAEALSGDEGDAVRTSQTLTEKHVYIAKLLPDGRVLRVSGTQVSILSLVYSMRWYILGSVVVSIAVAYLISRRIAQRIVDPINEINPEIPELDDGYEELSPLIKKLNRQKWDIADQSSTLRRKQRELSVITENMREGLLMIDNSGEILSCNASALELLGAHTADIGGSIYALNRSEAFRHAVGHALEGEHTEAIMNTGGLVCRLIASPVKRYGEVTGAVILIMDETEKQERESLRREFTSNVSHELKTPLTSIYGASDLLLSGMVKPEDEQNFVKIIHDESGRLITLIEDIMRLSRLDENSPTEEREEVELYSLAQSVADRLKNNPAGVTLTVTGEETFVNGVRVILDEMIYNLCENAVKYNVPEGQVQIRISSDGDDAVICVDDSGIGIPEGERSRIFERFYRVDKSHSKKVGGTGLGLSIVKHAVMYHGGTVTVSDSDLGGTRMVVRIKK